ncbi:MAG: 4Fe-4S binding protein [Oscillospiraceae bacterium]|nr:4Fe-4S binding protein [Oscillospiraceae bacterium]
MAKRWYPVVDYSICIECGTCVEKCPHGVYDRIKSPSPVVRNPEGCVDHCHGCGNRCPVGAITYVGDDTGWVPPKGKKNVEKSEVGCSCGGGCC